MPTARARSRRTPPCSSGSDEVMEAIKKRLKAGTVLVTTDLAATPDTRSDKNMVVMDGPAK